MFLQLGPLLNSRIHLVDDYWIYGSLENINAFAFESYLGILKNCIRSGYKPLQQVAKHAFSENSMCLLITKYLADVNRSFCDGAGTYQTNIKKTLQTYC